MKNDKLQMVKEFHKTFNVPILDTPQIPSDKRCELRIALMQEELDEIKEAIKNDDIIEVLDGFCDLLYVLNGSLIEFGMSDIFDDAFDEVQRSNMSKSCDTMKDVLGTISYYKKKDGTEGNYKKIGDKWVVYRNKDNKVLKSINYSPANLKNILEK